MKPSLFLHRRYKLTSLTIVMMLVKVMGSAQADSLEYRVKAAFLYNFTKFVEWPVDALESRNPNMTVCIAGKDPFRSVLESTLAGKTTNGYRLTYLRISNPQGVLDCQVLFIGYSDKPQVIHWIDQVNDDPVLTVGEAPSFAENGGMIQFLIVDGKVRFDINQEAVRRSGLQMSSKLLSLARTVLR